MSHLFVVWMTTAGAFGFTAEISAAGACQVAAERKGQVFRLVDPGFRHAVHCLTPGCDFPGWVTVPVNCVREPERKKTIPAHWSIQ